MPGVPVPQPGPGSTFSGKSNMKTESLHRGWGRFAAVAGVLALLLAAPSSASAADFLSGAVSDFPTDWSVSDGLQPEAVATKSVSGAELRLAFDLDANQSLTYAPPTASDAGGRADVVISNAVFSTAYDYPGPEDVGGIEAQAAICVHTNGTGGLEYCGWAGAYAGAGTATTNLTWFVLSGATPVEGATNTVTMSFDYTVSPATVTFKIGDTELTPKPVALETTKTQVSAVSFSGRGSIGELAGETAPNEYLVTFYTNDLATASWTTNVPANTVPVYLGAAPAKQATDRYTFHFAGWTNAVCTVPTNLFDAVTAPVNYYAAFTNTVNRYTVAFVDEDGSTVLKAATAYDYGTAAADIEKPSDPTKTATDQYAYTFAGWSPAVEEVTSNATYRATYTETLNTYTITWKNEDGTVLETDANVSYGSQPSYDSAAPDKASTAEYGYVFDGWTNATVSTALAPAALPTVTGATTYGAAFHATNNVYTLTWTTDGDELTGTYTSGLVPFGTTIVQPDTPTKTGYSFNEWTPAPVAGTMPAANTTYTATWNPATDTVYTVNHVQQALDGSYPASPTETESKETLDHVATVMRELYELAHKDPEYMKSAPHTALIGRLDEVQAARNPILTWKADD